MKRPRQLRSFLHSIRFMDIHHYMDLLLANFVGSIPVGLVVEPDYHVCIPAPTCPVYGIVVDFKF